MERKNGRMKPMKNVETRKIKNITIGDGDRIKDMGGKREEEGRRSHQRKKERKNIRK